MKTSLKHLELPLTILLFCFGCSTDTVEEPNSRYVLKNRSGQDFTIYMFSDYSFSLKEGNWLDTVFIQNGKETERKYFGLNPSPFTGNRIKIQFANDRAAFFNKRSLISAECANDPECRSTQNPYFINWKPNDRNAKKEIVYEYTFSDSLYLLAK